VNLRASPRSERVRQSYVLRIPTRGVPASGFDQRTLPQRFDSVRGLTHEPWGNIPAYFGEECRDISPRLLRTRADPTGALQTCYFFSSLVPGAESLCLLPSGSPLPPVLALYPTFLHPHTLDLATSEPPRPGVTPRQVYSAQWGFEVMSMLRLARDVVWRTPSEFSRTARSTLFQYCLFSFALLLKRRTFFEPLHVCLIAAIFSRP
jgi:hypothetical protein